MIFKKTTLNGAYLIEPQPIEDQRGFFSRLYCRNEFEAHGLNPRFVQCNIAFNKKPGIIRGMHFQAAPHEEVKLVRCTKGEILDVIIDLDPASPTYCQWEGFVLNEHNRFSLYVPEKFAHGYQTLTDDSEIFYQVSSFYSPESERGIRWNDPKFDIQWREPGEAIISEKDSNWPDFA